MKSDPGFGGRFRLLAGKQAKVVSLLVQDWDLCPSWRKRRY